MLSLALVWMGQSGGVLGLSDPNAYQPKGPRLEFVLESKATFVITTDPKLSPTTTEHVLALARKGFYDRQRFHRVEPWVTQWGAPQSRNQPLDILENGKSVPNPAVAGGGSGRSISIFEPGTNVDFYRGIVGVASTGLGVPGDSQLFILKRDAFRLYGSYAILGKVTAGMTAVAKIRRGDRILEVRVLPPANK